ncbi:MAG: exodeoxyribonuclease VII large subunit, partial [Proteobacteria bacterium]
YNAADKSWIVPNTEANVQKVGELCKSVGGGIIKETSGAPTSTASAAPAYPSASRPSVPTLAVAQPMMPPALTNSSLKTNSLPDKVDAEGKVSDGYSIAELMRQAQLAITQSFPRSLWVIGEIQNIRWHTTGVYFQLADAKEGGSQSATVTVNSTIWRSQLRDLERKFGDTLKEVLQDGFRVRVLADLSLFKDRGQLSLQIQSIDPNFTKGSLALQREKLLKELRQKGLIEKNRQLPLSPFPFKVGLLSAEDSRAKSDFIDQLQVYGFPGEVIFQPCQMQGEATLKDVVNGLKILQSKGCDLIVMTRGGGSAADLRWFDSAEIAYAIAEAGIPIIAAIGHHEDVCVAEDICYQREKTPTAAADFIISIFQKTRERLDQLSLSLDKILNDRVKLFDAYLAQLMEKMRAEALNNINDQRRLMDQAEASLELNWSRRVMHWSARLDQQQTSLRQSLDLRVQKEIARASQQQTSLRQGLDLRVQREQARLSQGQSNLNQGLKLRLQREMSRLDQQRETLLNRSMINVERIESRMKDLAKDLKRGAEKGLLTAEQALTRAEAAIKQKDPQ